GGRRAHSSAVAYGHPRAVGIRVTQVLEAPHPPRHVPWGLGRLGAAQPAPRPPRHPAVELGRRIGVAQPAIQVDERLVGKLRHRRLFALAHEPDLEVAGGQCSGPATALRAARTTRARRAPRLRARATASAWALMRAAARTM